MKISLLSILPCHIPRRSLATWSFLLKYLQKKISNIKRNRSSFGPSVFLDVGLIGWPSLVVVCPIQQVLQSLCSSMVVRYIMLSEVNQLWHLFDVVNQTGLIRLMFLQISRPEILEARTSTIQQIIWRMSLERREIRTVAMSSQFLVNSECNEANTWSQPY